MLTAQIREDMLAAMKARDQVRLDTLRMALSAFTNELVAKMRKPTDTLTDPEVITVIKRLVKQRKDSAEQFTGGGRPELAEKELAEIQILNVYLPATADHETIMKIARAKKEELGVSDASGAGKLMGAVMKELGAAGNSDDVKAAVASLFQ
jgi:uncharacterized protein YqeY